jgi:isoleucyl-tRNA synthetase
VYRPLDANVDFPALEARISQFWADADVFAESVRRTAGAPQWVFYEGPPTANGMPGTHHVEGRVFKDIFPRYRTMRGYHVPRRAGWDCHGLPVELAVEKELGFTGKGDIEAYGIAEFNERCRESVRRHVEAFARMSERMGYWVDYDDAYWTMDPSYIESVWWSLKRIFDRGLLVEDFRVTPYCPRCGTGLSDHEVSQGYADVTDPSVYVRMPLTDGPWAARGAALLVWTTTPWTLVSNTAVAVGPDVTYCLVDAGGELLVVAEPLVGAVLGDDAHVVDTARGADLAGWHYSRPFDLIDVPDAHLIVTADYVTVEDGTGLVHQAPAFGAEDMAVCRRNGLPVVNPIGRDGHFEASVPLVGGMFFKDADQVLVAALSDAGLLFRRLDYLHSYPHCWRCDTPLIYYPLPAWFVRTTVVADRLVEENERTTWYPATIKHGRYGDWLANNIDWALSRDRYWGTPLPIWRCADGHLTCVGSLAELSELAGRDVSAMDPHRPQIDDVTLPCTAQGCGEIAARVPQVIDCWYDSGAMPFAQWGAPHRNNEQFEATYPAQFIAEGLDQTRGWFYTLMAIGTLVFDRSSYETVLCLGIILAEDGRRMSKHLGNILDPFELFDRHGADAVRWFMLCGGNPWSSRRVGHAVLDEVVRKVLLTYWNTASFFVRYANAAATDPTSPGAPAYSAADYPAPAVAQRPALDRWALAELADTVAEVTAALDDFDPTRAGRRLTTFIDDLSNWYVRRSRRRFWAGPATEDGASAFATLETCLVQVTGLLAPFVPFVTDEVWQVLVAERDSSAPASVHLSSWPEPADDDAELRSHMALVRRLVELGRAARAGSSVRTRQPLSAALIAAPGVEAVPDELLAELAAELNVLRVDTLSAAGELVDLTVKPNFRELGRQHGSSTQQVAAAISAADPAELVGSLRATGSATVIVDGQETTVSAEQVLITETPRTGWAVSSDGGETVALDLELTDQLRAAGIVREVVRLVQQARKDAGLDVSDRIRMWWTSTDATVSAAVHEGAALIAGEVLATSVTQEPAPMEALSVSDEDLPIRVWLEKAVSSA